MLILLERIITESFYIAPNMFYSAMRSEHVLRCKGKYELMFGLLNIFLLNSLFLNTCRVDKDDTITAIYELSRDLRNVWHMVGQLRWLSMSVTVA